MSQLVNDRFDESTSEIRDRQNRERNVVIFKLSEPVTNIISERQNKDLTSVQDMIIHMAAETEEEVAVEKVIRLGRRHENYQTSPRPAIVTFTNLEGKRSFLRNSSSLKDSEDVNINNISCANDLTKKDRDRETELVSERNEKNSSEGGPWRYVIRGAPGERTILKIKKQ